MPGANVTRVLARTRLVRLLLLLLAVIVVIALRQTDKLVYPQFWAEDAVVFYLEAEHQGAASLVVPYNGYWHATPRLVALVGTHVPIAWLPSLYAYAAVALTALFLAVLLEGGATTNRPIQWACVFTVLLTPASGEIWATITNVQWIAATGLVAILATPPPTTRSGRVLLLTMTALVALTGPFAILLWPCAALRAWWWRDRYSLALLVLVTVGVLATAVALSHHPRAEGLTTRISGTLLRVLQAAGRRPLEAVVVAATAAFLVTGTAIGVRRRDWPLVACGVACLCLTAGSILTVPPEHLGARYFFIPWIAGTWLALLLLDRGYRFAWAAVAAALVVSLARFPLTPLQRYDWPRDAQCLETHATCNVTINPSWKVGLPGRGRLAS
ncbi:MAG TPA: hypothetical protein VMF13_23665 [Luteitalea sp.]|nr:hypothetical protein [Luteitalea sp.]